MTERFRARLEILPDSQRQIWRELRPLSELGYVLYGGTAIALRLGHRVSIDFDFFSEQELRKELLAQALSFWGASRVIQDQPNACTVLAYGSDQAPVKLSFFGGIDFGRVENPQMTQDDILQVASLDDLMATKLKAMLQRIEAKVIVMSPPYRWRRRTGSRASRSSSTIWIQLLTKRKSQSAGLLRGWRFGNPRERN